MPTTDDQRDPAVAAAPVTDPDVTVPDPDVTVPDSDPPPAGRRKKSWRQLMMVVVAAIVLMLLIKAFVVQVYRIPSSSMEDTLLTGDRVLVNKLIYHVRGIARGDIVVFSGDGSWGTTTGAPDPSPPGNPLLRFAYDVLADVGVYSTQTYYIKRVIGLPGDHIQMKNGILFLNGQPVPRRRIEDYLYQEGNGAVIPLAQYIETLPNGVQHRIIEMSDNGPLDNTQEYVVPPGDYFMMGDNRDNSQDSRVLSAVGYVPAENLIGKAQFIFFSTNGSARLWEIWRWPFAIRYGRLFHGVQGID